MAEKTKKLRVDLDTKEAIRNANALKEALELAASGQGFQALGAIVSAVGAPLIALTGILVGLGLTIKATFSVEALNQAENNFNNLANSFGVNADKMKADLIQIADGMIDDSEAIEIASDSILRLGENSGKTAELFGLARKMAMAFGKDAKDVMQELTSAYESGNVKMLRNYGIIVDSEKVISDYARANGVLVSELTDAAKKQAVMNEALDIAHGKFDENIVSISRTADAWRKLKTSAGEFWEATVKVFVKYVGPLVTDAMEFWSYVIGDVAKKWQGLVGDAKKAGDEMNAALKKTDNGGGGEEGARREIARTEEVKLRKLKAKQEINDAELQYEAEHLKNIENGAMAEEAIERQKVLIVQQAEFEKSELRLKSQKDFGTITQETKEREFLIEQETNEKIMALDRQKLQARIGAEQLALQNSTAFGKQAAAQAALTASQMKKSWQDAGGAGGIAMKTFGKTATQAFIELGEGGKSGTEILKKAVFGMISDMAIQYGSMLLLTSIWPPNPVGLAAGAALLVLGGYLKSLSGGAGSSAQTGGGGGSNVGETKVPSPTSETLATTSAQESQKHKVVNINIAGHYFDTDQTRQVLTNIIRQGSDATDFNVSTVGV